VTIISENRTKFSGAEFTLGHLTVTEFVNCLVNSVCLCQALGLELIITPNLDSNVDFRLEKLPLLSEPTDGNFIYTNGKLYKAVLIYYALVYV